MASPPANLTATCFDIDQQFDPITIQCNINTTLGDLYMEVAHHCKTNPFHLTIFSASNPTEPLTLIETPLMLFLQADDIFRFHIHSPLTFSNPRTEMTDVSSSTEIPAPLGGPFETLKDIPSRTILNPSLYFSTLRANSEKLLPQLAASQPKLVEYVKNNDPVGFYHSIQFMRFEHELKKAVKKLHATLTAQSAQPGSAQSLSHSQAQAQAQASDPPLTEEEKAEEEKRKRIEENLLLTMEYAPENFANVHMLYIRAELNGVPIKVFVDSGAQMSIMSKSCAARVGLLDLIDSRFTGVAVGVGTNKIVGRVHGAHLTVGNAHLLCALCVLEDSRVDLILGLEQMMANQMIIDLKYRVLRVGDEAVSFLPEHEIPKSHFGAIDPSKYEEVNEQDHKDTLAQHEIYKEKRKAELAANKSKVDLAPSKPTSTSSSSSSSTSSSSLSSSVSSGQTQPSLTLSSQVSGSDSGSGSAATMTSPRPAHVSAISPRATSISTPISNNISSPTSTQMSPQASMPGQGQTQTQRPNGSQPSPSAADAERMAQTVLGSLSPIQRQAVSSIQDLGMGISLPHILMALNQTNFDVDQAMAIIMAMIDN